MPTAPLSTTLDEAFYLREPGGTKMQIPLNGQPQRTPSSLKLSEREVAQLLLEPHDPAKEHIRPVKLNGIPRPLGIRGEKLAEHQRVRLVFLRVQRGKLLPQLLRQQLHVCFPPPHKQSFSSQWLATRPTSAPACIAQVVHTVHQAAAGTTPDTRRYTVSTPATAPRPVPQTDHLPVRNEPPRPRASLDEDARAACSIPRCSPTSPTTLLIMCLRHQLTFRISKCVCVSHRSAFASFVGRRVRTTVKTLSHAINTVEQHTPCLSHPPSPPFHLFVVSQKEVPTPDENLLQQHWKRYNQASSLALPASDASATVPVDQATGLSAAPYQAPARPPVAYEPGAHQGHSGSE